MTEESPPAGRLKRVLVTGASGFVGSALVRVLGERPGFHVRGAYRTLPKALPSTASFVGVDHLGPDTDWTEALQSVDVVVHCAARVHQSDIDCDARETENAYRRANVDGARRLAIQAVEAGCRRFIFISSAKAGGGGTAAGRPLIESDEAAPVDAYGRSKLAAEQALFALAKKTALEVVVVRPPLVYGPGVKANFRRMIGWLNAGFPLPLGAIRNQRSLVALDNLCDFVTRCLWHPAAAGQIFYVSDDEDVSTSELLRRMACALGRTSRLIPVPEKWLRRFLCAVGHSDMIERLLGSLQVDCTKAKALLDWTPRVSLDAGLKQTADAFRSDFHHGR